MNAGDICLVHSGIYRELIVTTKSGTSSHPITIKAFASDTVIVRATEALSDWTEESENIYKQNVSMTLNERNSVYLNGQSMQIARWPNDRDQDPFTSIANKDFSLVEDSSIIDKGLVVPGINSDFKGTAPDIGAYEFGGEKWGAGSMLKKHHYYLDSKKQIKLSLIKFPVIIPS